MPRWYPSDNWRKYGRFTRVRTLASPHQITVVRQQATAALLDRLRDDNGDKVAILVLDQWHGLGVAALSLEQSTQVLHVSTPCAVNTACSSTPAGLHAAATKCHNGILYYE